MTLNQKKVDLDKIKDVVFFLWGW